MKGNITHIMLYSTTPVNERPDDMPQRRFPPPPGYVTATRAKQLLGNISDGLLRSYVVKGDLERLVPDTRSQGFYRAENVRDLARRLNIDQSIHFARGTVDDLAECDSLLIKIFGGSNPVDADGRPIAANPMERRATWLEKNPDSLFILRAGKRIVGCVFLLALTRGKIEQVLSEDVTIPIYAEDVQTYVPGVPTHLYAMSACVYAYDKSIATKRFYGSRLLSGVLKRVIQMGQEGIAIEAIWSRSRTPDGIGLLKNVGFTEIVTHTRCRNFLIDVNLSGIQDVVRYKRAFATWQESRQEPQERPVTIAPRPTTPKPDKATTAPHTTSQGAFAQGNLPTGYVALSEFYHGIARSTAKRNAALTEGDWRDATGHVVNMALSPEQQAEYYKWASNRPGFVACPECPHGL